MYSTTFSGHNYALCSSVSRICREMSGFRSSAATLILLSRASKEAGPARYDRIRTRVPQPSRCNY